jgi:hypothetical protein
MARLDLRVFIRATPERVWEVISDLEGQRRWMVDLRDLSVVGGEPGGLGTQVQVTSELFGLPLVKDKMTITVWDPPHRLDVRHAGSFSGTGSFLLEPVRGGTVFTWIEDFRSPLGPLGELGFSLVVGPHLRRVFRRSMNNVRRLAESVVVG